MPLLRKGGSMLGKFYESVLDVELYRQMADLIYRLSEVKEKEQLYTGIKNGALFTIKPEMEMEDAFGFRYPGEVLERLDEKETVTKKQLRALGLALVLTKPLQNDGMFVGKQMPSFWKWMKRTLKPTDLYWIGIQYLMEDQQMELYHKLLDFPVQSIEEMVFIISLLPDEQSVWENVKGKLNQFLGKERLCSAYTHTEIYAWLTTRYHIRISGYRKKDIETLKYLMRLPFSYAKEGSIARKKLLEAGYSVQEIMFISMSLLYQVSACDLLKKTGLTVERMAVETCMLFLSGKGEFLDQAGELCARLLKDYGRFDVCLDGTNRIRDYLYQSLKVENVKTYQILLLDDMWDSMHSNWFLIDLTDAKWQELYSLIERDSFDKWVFETLKVKPYTKNQMERYLQVYQDLTNEDFYQHFWKIEDSDLKVIFRKLADLGLVYPLGLLKSYLEEYQSNKEEAGKKWIMMIQYLKAYMEGLKTPEAVEMVFQIEKQFGISSREPFPIEKLFLDSIGIDNEYRGLYFESMDLIRPFLDIKGHQQMFCIVEQYMLKMHPEKYISFLIKVLSSEDNFFWFPKEEARKVFWKLAEISKNQSELDRLRRIYLTEEDFEAVKAERREREQRHLLVKQRKKIRDIRKDFSLYVAKARKTGCQFETLWNYVQNGMHDWKSQKERNYIIKRYLCSLFQNKTQVILEKKEIENLCKLAQFLFSEEELTFFEMREILGLIELKEEKLDEAV